VVTQENATVALSKNIMKTKNEDMNNNPATTTDKELMDRVLSIAEGFQFSHYGFKLIQKIILEHNGHRMADGNVKKPAIINELTQTHVHSRKR